MTRRALAIALVAFAAGFMAASWWNGPITTVGRADTAADGGGSISTDEWTYGFADGVDWIDRTGAINSGTAPECLVPGESVNVRFAAAKVSVDGASWRPVVWVDCRTATPYEETAASE